MGSKKVEMQNTRTSIILALAVVIPLLFGCRSDRSVRKVPASPLSKDNRPFDIQWGTTNRPTVTVTYSDDGDIIETQVDEETMKEFQQGNGG